MIDTVLAIVVDALGAESMQATIVREAREQIAAAIRRGELITYGE